MTELTQNHSGSGDNIVKIIQTPEFNFSDRYFSNQTDRAIDDLGPRYIPNIYNGLNVDLEITKYFNSISRNTTFKQRLDILFVEVLKSYRELDDSDNCAEVNTLLLKTLKTLIVFRECFESLTIEGVDLIELDFLCDNSDELREILQELIQVYERKRQEPDKVKKKKAYGYYLTNEQAYKRKIQDVNTLLGSIYSLEKYLKSTEFKLVNCPFLLLQGDAGIGKSHILADAINNRKQDNQLSLLFLGQHLKTDELPFNQILKNEGYSGGLDTYLEKLNNEGKKSKSRLIIFIDALNEGNGKSIWKDSLLGLLSTIKKYEWLGLVISIRSEYVPLICPKEDFTEDHILRITHYGFSDNSFDATELFFKNFNIQFPSVPLLNPEFNNPLFLLKFCEGIKKSGRNTIPKGIQGFTSILDFYLKSINKNLSEKIGYRESLNLVEKSINSLIEKGIVNQQSIPYEEAFILINQVTKSFIDKKNFIDDLIYEGVLLKSVDHQGNEFIYFVYERFQDYLIAQFLLKGYSTIEGLKNTFSSQGDLYKYIEKIYMYQGLVNAFSILIPEKFNEDLLSIVEEREIDFLLVESFTNSLLWRRRETISDITINNINKYSLRYTRTSDLFFENIIMLSSEIDHPLNSNLLHSHLWDMSITERDEDWTIWLNDKIENESSVKRLIDWAWSDNDKSYISDESLLLTCTTLSWFLTSTNRKLRDSATKGLVSLLENKISILLDLLQKFKGVSDPYIYERLFAVAYGCALRTSQKDELVELSVYIFNIIFNKNDEVFPHILLRDYARGVVEYTISLGYSLSFDIEKIKPPYKSFFPKELPLFKDIEKEYEIKSDERGFKDYQWAQNSILSSMAPNATSMGMYGDFGRYTFQSAVEKWDIDIEGVAGLATQWIFEKYGYDIEKFGEFDRSMGSGRARNTPYKERIGKKYQWLAFYEILARISDNCVKWDPQYSYGNNKKREQYIGAFSPYVRDIDPTTLLHKTASREYFFNEKHWWDTVNYTNFEVPSIDWTQLTSDYPNAGEYIEVTDEKGEKWIMLEGHPSWKELKKFDDEYPYKNLWYQIRGYLIKKQDSQKFKNWSTSQDYMGRWMPDSTNRYELFSREYYWSSSYSYFKKPYYSGELWKNISSIQEDALEVIIPTINHLWEEENDYSKNEVVKFLRPIKEVFDGMDLSYGLKEGQYISEEGEVICFDPSVYNPTFPCLLIKKRPFLEYLKKNDLEVFWTVLGEKLVIRGTSAWKYGRSQISGTFFYEGDNLKGKVNYKKTPPNQ